MHATPKLSPILVSVFLLGSVATTASCQERGTRSFVVVNPHDGIEEITRKAANVCPSPRQLRWQELECIAFIHFTINTFTDREWGLGTEDPKLFNPTALDARQWVKVLKEAGLKMVILTAKHHDGFCLWPSRYTDRSVKNSPWRGGRGDLVGEVSAACREFGLKFGVYLSPWDRHEATYGDSPKYNEFFRNQLRELLTNYGEVSEVWFDGACGEGPNGKRQVYDWNSYYRLIRELQPGAVISIMGPDVRWVGTESGYGRDTEWSVVPDILRNVDSIAAASQQNPVDGAFVPGDLTGEDLGSRDRIRTARSLVWYPAETDVSIRPGWFYHKAEDGRVKGPEKLVDIYYSSVGKNSVLLLNIPPDTRGRIHENDIKSLLGMRKILDQTFRTNLLSSAAVTATSESAGHMASAVLDHDKATYWTTDVGLDTATLEFALPDTILFDRVMLQEHILTGQRVEQFHLDALRGTKWVEFTRGTTIGYKRLLRFQGVHASKVRLVIERARTSPALSEVGLFKAPPRVVAEPGGGAFQDSLSVRLRTDVNGGMIFYSLDGSDPSSSSKLYGEPILLTRSTLLKAAAQFNGEPGIERLEAQYVKCLPVQHIRLEKPNSPKYAAEGSSTLINGRRGQPDSFESEWLGFEGDNLVATLDLGAVISFRKITAGFLQDQNSWVFLPSNVEFSISIDGVNWRSLGEQSNPLEKADQVCPKDFASTSGPVKARFVKVVATSIGVCPSWHPGAGKKAWIFSDEIIIE